MDAPAQTSVLNKPLLTFFSVIGLYIKVIPMGSTRVVRACSRFDYPVVRSTTRADDRSHCAQTALSPVSLLGGPQRTRVEI